MRIRLILTEEDLVSLMNSELSTKELGEVLSALYQELLSNHSTYDENIETILDDILPGVIERNHQYNHICETNRNTSCEYWKYNKRPFYAHRKSRLNPIEPKSSYDSYDSPYTLDFLKFYSKYPLKIKKYAAFKEWKRLNPSEKLQKIIIENIPKYTDLPAHKYLRLRIWEEPCQV